MTPKEQAEKLYNTYLKFCNELSHDKNKTLAKLMALACVNEIELYRKQIEAEFDEDLYHAYGVEEYWNEVKQEIKQL